MVGYIDIPKFTPTIINPKKMKKLLLLLIFLPSISLAQNDEDTPKVKPKIYKWELGFNGGVNLTNVTGLDSINSINKFGRLYGLTVTYHFNRIFSLKGDFDFENKGWVIDDIDYNINGIDTSGGITQVLNYFDLPAFMHIGFGKKIKFDFNFGPYFGYLLNAKTINSDNQEVIIDHPSFSDFSNIDYGFIYGLGLDFILSERISLGFDFLVEEGLKEINDQGLKNRSLNFDFGINFMLGKKK